MHENLVAIILGLVQGLTEFLPISSTGHLIITSALLDATGDKIHTFEIVIQLGSILAVVVLYWKRFWGLLFPQQGIAFSGIRGLYLLFLTSLPASLVGLFANKLIKAHLFNPVSVSLALAVGGLFILFAEKRNKSPKYASLDDITPIMALGVGLFQCLSLWPGFSRSASTIMGGLLLGAKRELAAEYSFMAAVPIMFAATGYSLLADAAHLSSADIPFFAIGTLVAFFSALAAIKILVGLVSRISFRPFAWYRIILAPIIFYIWYY